MAGATAETRQGGSGLRVETTTDVHQWLSVVSPLLDADPVGTSVLGTVSERVRRSAEPGTWWCWLTDPAGPVVGAGMNVPPRGIHLSSMPAGAATLVADAAYEQGRVLPTAGGPRAAAEELAARWTALTGSRARVVMEQGTYATSRVVAPPSHRVPAGRARRAVAADVALMRTWVQGFLADTGLDDPAHVESVPERVHAGDVHVWEGQDGTPVSMAMLTDVVRGVARVQGVYTPPEARRGGAAGALVAAVAQGALDAGAEAVMLYTDLANPTSNRIYRAVGFARVGEGVLLALEPPTADPGSAGAQALTTSDPLTSTANVGSGAVAGPFST